MSVCVIVVKEMAAMNCPMVKRDIRGASIPLNISKAFSLLNWNQNNVSLAVHHV